MAVKRKGSNFCIYDWMQNLRDYVDGIVYYPVLILFAYLWQRVEYEKKEFFNYSVIAAGIDSNSRQARYYLDLLAHLGLVRKEQCLVNGVKKLRIKFDYDMLRKLLHYRDNQGEKVDLSPCLEKVLNVWNDCDNLIKHHKGTKLLERAEDALISVLSRGYKLDQVFLSIRNYDYLLGLEFSDINQELPGYRVGLDEFLGGFSHLTKRRMERANVKLNFKSWFEECLQPKEKLAMKWCRSFGCFNDEERQLIVEWKIRLKQWFGNNKGSDKDWLFLARDCFKMAREVAQRFGRCWLRPTSYWKELWDEVLNRHFELRTDNPRKLRSNLKRIMEKIKEMDRFEKIDL